MFQNYIFTIAAAICLLIFTATPTVAANFTVNALNDATDAIPGDGTCATAAANCTLRAAIVEANALAGDDTIDFDPALFPNDQIITLTLGQLPITSNITITWGGYPQKSLTVSGNNASRIFEVTSSTFSLSNLVLSNGSATPNGGAINISGSRATVNINNSLLQNNVADTNGGAINISGGALNITNSIIDNNRATFNDGGGIWMASSTATLNGVNITNNRTLDPVVSDAGGIFVGSGGALTMNNCNVANNATPNTPNALGGGMEVTGITTVRIDNSTFSGNRAWQGGAIYNLPDPTSTFNISNSTISNNIAVDEGGGIRHGDTPMTLRNVTIAYNSSGTRGGGIARPNGVLNLGNTIIGNNTAPTSPDFYNNGNFISLGNNLVEVPDGGGYIASDIIGIDPGLGTLGFNGGRTRTIPLLGGSPAINTGGNTQALSSNGAPLTTDQRGGTFARIVGTAVDIGAFESGNAPTSALVEVSGRVTSSSGRGISYARVHVTEATTGETRVVITNPFGYYRFIDVRAGSAYLFEVKAKRYTFAPQVVTVSSAINDLNFVAQ